MKRINVVGVSGSGKSTFSKRLAKSLRDHRGNGVPCIEMDALYWRKDWTETPKEEFCELLEQRLQDAGDCWVLDGNYHRTTAPIKWKHCDTVIWIDYGFWRTLYQAIKRALWRSCTRQEIWPGTGCRETFGQLFFSSDSIVWWTITMYRKVKVRYQEAMTDGQQKYPRLKFVQLRSPRETQEFLDSLSGIE